MPRVSANEGVPPELHGSRQGNAMLILSRKAEQTVQIGERIRVTILSIRGNRVKIGLDAPDSVQILRGELETFCEPLGSKPEEEEVVKADG